MTALVFAEARNGKLHAGVAQAITAAQTFGEVDVIVFADQPVAVPCVGIRKLYQVTDASLAQPTVESPILTLAAQAKSYTHIMAPHSTFSRSVLARLSACLRAPMFSDVIALDATTITRPCYAGAVCEVLQANAPQILMTIRPSSFAPAAPAASPAPEVIALIPTSMTSRVTAIQQTASSRPELTTAKVVVSGGRGLGSKEKFALIEELADTLGAAVGASRAAVDAGFVAGDLQVGQTGKTVAPQLYIALGISGAVQHLAGIKGAKTIVAVNKDPNAPIFKVADYGLVADLFDVVPQLVNELKK
jgi:electron transfer flavoprotein alpha subunit